MDTSNKRSVFWPVVLITVGVIWLLANLGFLPPFNAGLLFDLWPLILIGVGISIIIGRRAPLLRAGIILFLVFAALGYAFYAPSLGLVEKPQVQEAVFSEQLGEAEQATIVLENSVGRTRIQALGDSSDLMSAELSYLGEVDFDVEGTRDKRIVLTGRQDRLNGDLIETIEGKELYWDIGLTPQIPLTIEFAGGVGEIELDLTGLTLNGLTVAAGVGEIDVLLPAQAAEFPVSIRGGVGSFTITIPDGAQVQLHIEAGVGDITVDVPDNAGVEIRLSTGVGNIRLPAGYLEVDGTDRPVGMEGAWVSPNYSQAETFITIEYRGGVGGFLLR